MGDWYQTVVDPVVSSDDAGTVADGVVAEPVAAGLVKPEYVVGTVTSSIVAANAAEVLAR